ncbi:PAAR domain-containing protein, partial [Capnocytophaga sp. oral taxon 324]|uniref:PAAR domain-containing protein n=1 Tax=Capnocytophaga sp. oral taxon 324 TaxID=712211 RepID=UPI0002A298A0
MDKKQVVTINTMHTCPMTTGNTPHVGGPIIGPGCSTATLNGIPIALQGDKCICAAGGQDVILQGCPTATINGVPIALQGSPTAHGGTIPAGVPGAVIISKNTSVLEAGAEGEPAVYNLQWKKEDLIVQETKVEKVVTLVADTRNISDGEEVVIKVHTKEPDGGSTVVAELKGIVENNQVKVDWKVEEQQEPTEPSADCTVRFVLGKNENNNFGFDSYEVSKKGCKDKEKLKSAYKKLEPFREEYLMPWISLGKGETIFLKQKIKGKYKEITFKEPKSYFTFEPATITPKTEQVKITCNDTITEKEYKVEVLADGKVAGGLMFVGNSVKHIIVRPVFVLESKNEGQKKELKDIAGKEKLEKYFKKAFAPSLIKTDVKEPYKLSLSENDYIHPDKALNYIKGIRACFNIKNGIEIENPTDDKREELIKNLNQLFILSKIENKIETINEIVLFLTNFQCTGDKSAKEVPDSYNGFTYGKSVIMMFLANKNVFPNVEIPHEVMHALDLEHTFDSKEVYHFTKGATKNYMDYDNKKKYTFKWQWEKMRNSKWIIVPLLFLLFVLNACSSYKNIDCNYNYNIREEEKKVDTLSSDFKWYTEKKINNDAVWYEKPLIASKVKRFTKYIEKDTLGIEMNTLIEYDLEGNIKSVRSSIPYIPVGREFIFDDQGNIKEVINHDEGWKICAFQ